MAILQYALRSTYSEIDRSPSSFDRFKFNIYILIMSIVHVIMCSK
jgi:hypothetical protein